jgi:hypothetical protein
MIFDNELHRKGSFEVQLHENPKMKVVFFSLEKWRKNNKEIWRISLLFRSGALWKGRKQ